MRNIKESRIKKTLMLLDNPREFIEKLEASIDTICRNKTPDKEVAIRLNGTSDLDWSKTGIMDNFPEVQFYDYTKVPRYFRKAPDNYHLTFSMSESNEFVARTMLKNGHNVAMVITGDSIMPKSVWHTPTIDGDLHDLRFLDPSPRVVILRAKGTAKHDTTGFVKYFGGSQ